VLEPGDPLVGIGVEPGNDRFGDDVCHRRYASSFNGHLFADRVGTLHPDAPGMNL
jgi:hypothetical protein